MKLKFCIIFTFFLMFRLYSIEAVLMDFSNLNDTTIDFSDVAPGYYTPEEKEVMKISLHPKFWSVKVNPSSLTFLARTKTYVLPINNTTDYPNQTVLGLRIYFPERHANSYAEILPPFEIPTYYDNKTDPNGMGTMFIGRGVVRNIGVLKKLSITALGNNYKYGIIIKLRNRNGEIKDIFMGYLNYVGWQTLTWVNPNYDKDVYIRAIEKDARPYYPDQYPYVKLEGIIIQRVDPNTSGNFVAMIKDIKIEYDEQFLDLGTETIQKQEANFNIYKEDLLTRANAEMQFVNKRLLGVWLENKKIHRDK